MPSVDKEILAIEEQLRVAQLNADSASVEHLLDDRMLLLSDSKPFFAKARLMEMYAPASGRRFTSVEWKDVQIIHYGEAAVVICRGEYRTTQSLVRLGFMRLWLKRAGEWKLIAGTVSEPAAP